MLTLFSTFLYFWLAAFDNLIFIYFWKSIKDFYVWTTNMKFENNIQGRRTNFQKEGA